MPTTVTSSIGTSGRTYSTLQAWEDACPANLVTDDKIWKGECYNDSEFTGAAPLLTFSGVTADATRYLWLTTAAGQSFRDHASVQSNALRYNQSNGVGVKSDSSTRTHVINIQTTNTLVENLQVITVGAGYAGAWPVTAGVANTTVKNCILEDVDTSRGGYVVGYSSDVVGNQLTNCLLVAFGHDTVLNVAAVVGFEYGEILNCTVVKFGVNTNSAAFGGASYDGGMGAVKNSAAFGFTSFRGGTQGTFTNCATDATSDVPGSGVTSGLTMANQFEDVTYATRDLRAKTGAGLIDAGATDTDATPDIAGTARPQGGAYDIGCWEKVAAAAGGHPAVKRMGGVPFAHSLGRGVW